MYRAVARMLRGDVAGLIAAAGLLAFVVTTNAQKLIHDSASAGIPEVMEAAASVDRTDLRTETRRSRDPRLAIPRRPTSGAATGGTASASGPLTGACCNFDGADNCEIMTQEACEGIVDAFYLGDDTVCVDCVPFNSQCGPGAGDCTVPHNGAGCDDIRCCSLVCDFLPLCCQQGQGGWDQACVDLANDSFCAPDPACGVPGTGSCTDGNTTPFCDDTCGVNGPCVGCCDIVCAVDPFCCGLLPMGTWDAFCDNEALALCGCQPADIPTNDDCANAIELFVAPPLTVTNSCGTSGLPDHATCGDGFVNGLGIDVWYFYVATFTGALSVRVTPDIDENWNTQMAAYEGCDCGALTDPPLECAAIGGVLVVPVTNGNCYLLRLGGNYLGPSGTGTVEVNAVPDACLSAVTDCLEPAGTPACNNVVCCTVVCLLDTLCCDVVWDQACADLARTDCTALPCPPIDTSSANLQELEDCGLDTNGGCNTDPDPPVFMEIVSGDVINGTAWADLEARDTDWYRLTIDPLTDVNGDGTVDVHLSVVSELPMTSFLIRDLNPTCEPPGPDSDTELPGTIAIGQSCICVIAGVGNVALTDVIYVFAAVADQDGGAIFEGFPCGLPEGPTFGNTYLLSVDVTDDGDPSPQQCGIISTPCPWDCQATPDGNVGINDFLDLLGTWNQVGVPCDFGAGPPGIGVEDFLELLAHWGACP